MSIKNFAQKVIFYPKALMLRYDIYRARNLIFGEYRYHVFDRLGIAGFGDHLLRIDFPPPHPVSATLGNATIALRDIFEKSHTQILDHFTGALQMLDEYGSLPLTKPSEPSDIRPWRNNEFFFGADIIALMYILERYSPKRFIEIGSGMSTRVARYTLGRDSKHQIISIDPEPRIAIEQIADKVIRKPLQSDSCADILEIVRPGDVVFFDGSHRSLPGSDVNVFFLELLPELPAGCIVHIHDIYLPYEYPSNMFNRFWSEQYMLATFLIAGGWRKLEPLMPIYYCFQRDEYIDVLGSQKIETGTGFWGMTR